MIQIPLNGLFNSVLKHRLRKPAQLIVDLCGINRIPLIVSLPVRHMSDQALRFAERLADQTDDINVAHLIVSADVVNLSYPSLPDDQVDRLAVIFHVQPVADIEPLSVDRKRLVRQRVGDHQRDQLFRELVGAVVIGAAADRRRQAVGSVIRVYQQIRGCLRAAVGAGGMKRRILRKEEIRPVNWQISVHLVRAYLVIPLNAIFPAGVHQNRCSDNVGLQENFRILNRAVHVGFRREVHHDIRMLLLKQAVYRGSVADIHFYETEIRAVHHRLQCREISGIGQLVQTDNPVIRMLFHHVKDKIGTDKPGSAGHYDIHIILLTALCLHLFFRLFCICRGYSFPAVFLHSLREGKRRGGLLTGFRSEYPHIFRSVHPAGTGRIDFSSAPRNHPAALPVRSSR